MTVRAYSPRIPKHDIDVVEAGGHPRKGRTAFDLGQDIKFSTAALESYAFARWEPLIYDVMMLAAAVEYADRSTRRPSLGWTRMLTLRLPVHSPQRWTAPDVAGSLQEALRFLTGDVWTVEFVQRRGDAPAPTQECLQLPVKTRAVIAYSEGMDSRAVTGLMAAIIGEQLVRVRVGSKTAGLPSKADREPFATVPYSVSARGESSARSRGFKFALISGIAAYLTDAGEIIVPESGQGAFGPALVTAAHAYPDYRNHPLFMKRIERFLAALFGRPFRISAPRLWYTKGETLKAYTALPGSQGWRDTKSCWRGAQWSALNGTLMQCGICAACMLRRMSVHAAGLEESDGTYVCDDLTAATIDAAVHKDFKRMSRAFREYAIAGTLHLDHLADIASGSNRAAVERHAVITAPSLGMTANEVHDLLRGVLERHAKEWGLFIKDAGARSFLRQWTR
jgi:Queuosine biosynthesis protein QueC